MDKKWTKWPKTPLGRASLILAAFTLLFWLSMPVLVQVLNRADFERLVGLEVVFSLFAFTVVSIVLGGISLFSIKDKSRVLLISFCALTLVVVLAIVGEILEAALLGG